MERGDEIQFEPLARQLHPWQASVVSLRFLGSWVDSVDAEFDACAAGVV
jgi:hypothetical protein